MLPTCVVVVIPVFTPSFTSHLPPPTSHLVKVSIALAKRRDRDAAVRQHHTYTLAQVLKDVGGAFEESESEVGAAGGPTKAAAAWLPCAVLIDDEGLAIAAQARPTAMRSTANLAALADDPAPTPPEPRVPALNIAAGSAAAGVPSPSHRLLLVEDSASMQTALTRFFSKLGYAVTVANNGREGLEQLTTEKFDVW